MDGPNHAGNSCNAPIMTNKRCSKYYKKLSYYYIGHFSKYIKQHSRNMAYSSFTDKIEVSAFLTSENNIVVVLLNRNNEDIDFSINIKNNLYSDNIKKHSIITLIINNF